MMRVGLLWFDDDPQRAIEEKVRRAANTCYVNPVSLQGDGHSKDGFRCGRVKMIVTPKVLPHHFWLGVADPSREKKQ